MVFRKPLLGEAEDFTVYIKNFIRFPKFNFSKYVGPCVWDTVWNDLPGDEGAPFPVQWRQGCVLSYWRMLGGGKAVRI